VKHLWPRSPHTRIIAEALHIEEPDLISLLAHAWIFVPCQGYYNYYDHKDETEHHAPHCTGTIIIPKHRLKNYRTADDPSQPVFIDPLRERGRCGNCHNAADVVRKREKRVKEFMEGLTTEFRLHPERRYEISETFTDFGENWSPGQLVPVIRSFSELKSLEKACAKLSPGFSLTRLVKTRHGTVKKKPFRFDAGRFQPGQKIHTPRPQDENNKITRTIAHLCREQSARAIVGLCLICDKLLFSAQYPVKVHATCFTDYQRGRGRGLWYMPVEQRPRRGARATVETLQKHYHWTTRHLLKDEPLSHIAEEFHVSKIAVWKGIKFITEHLPDPQQVPRKFRKRISLLRTPFSDLG
jgi:hypothetical protein